MQDTELFLSLAEIAGVFVGFGAVNAVRSGGPPTAMKGAVGRIGRNREIVERLAR